MTAPPNSRREFLAHLSAYSLAVAGTRAAVWSRPRFIASPFALGVASGDPTPDGVVLWTRLLPDVAAGGDVPPLTIPVRWEVAADEHFARIVRHGTAHASPGWAHSVHVEVQGLEPARWYWYRFHAGNDVSPVGRTRTAPASGATVERLRLAVASCQHYEQGLYTAYRHMAAEDVDAVLHLGDYIYESTVPGRPRQHGAPPPRTLDEYRARYALYKRDPDLQAAHAAFPWVVTWDDHEVENNYAGPMSSDGARIDRFLLQRAAAYRAYYEHMPLRRASIPAGPDLLLYRTLGFGGLARVHVLDTRQYRHDQACGDGRQEPCPGWDDATRSLMGTTQERWLGRGLVSSGATWRVVAQQVMMGTMDLRPGDGVEYAMDMWPGYPAARDRLLGTIADARVPNVVVLAGDIHAAFANDIRRGLQDDSGPILATEYVGSSIASAGDGTDVWPQWFGISPLNPWMKWHNARRGYLRCEVTPATWTSDYRVVPFVSRPGAPISTAASFVTEQGHAGVQRA